MKNHYACYSQQIKTVRGQLLKRNNSSQLHEPRSQNQEFILDHTNVKNPRNIKLFMENPLVCKQEKKTHLHSTWRPCNANICRGTLLFNVENQIVNSRIHPQAGRKTSFPPTPQFVMINKNTRRLFVDNIAC